MWHIADIRRKDHILLHSSQDNIAVTMVYISALNVNYTSSPSAIIMSDYFGGGGSSSIRQGYYRNGELLWSSHPYLEDRISSMLIPMQFNGTQLGLQPTYEALLYFALHGYVRGDLSIDSALCPLFCLHASFVEMAADTYLWGAEYYHNSSSW